MSQIRLNKTPEVEEVLTYLRGKYILLSEAEIIKVALAEKYSKEVSTAIVDEETEKIIALGIEDYKNGRVTVTKTDGELNAYLKSL